LTQCIKKQFLASKEVNINNEKTAEEKTTEQINEQGKQKKNSKVLEEL